MANHAYIPSRILGQDDLSTLTSFNLYDAARDEGDQDNVFSRILHKVRGAVASNESFQPSHSSSFVSLSSKVVSKDNELFELLLLTSHCYISRARLVVSWKIQERQVVDLSSSNTSIKGDPLYSSSSSSSITT